MVKVKYNEPRYLAIAKKIRDKGYITGDGGSDLASLESLDEDVIGIYKTRRGIAGFLTQTYYRIGILWLDEGRWQLSIYGRKYVSELNKLAEEISETYGVEIESELISEKEVTLI